MPRRFLQERRRDPYYRAAQAAGLRSRAAFKLAELAERFPIFRPGGSVLDLGAAPGGWSLVARELLGPGGRVVAVDPRRIEPAPGIEVVHASVGDPALRQRLPAMRFDTVLSDMSPAISGAYSTDHARSVDLAREAFLLCEPYLAEGGVFVAKVFQGDLVGGLVAEMRQRFRRVERTKPAASRARSSEIYVIGLDFARPG